jgi:hypothetical protein
MEESAMSSKALPDAGALVKLVTSLIGKQVTQKPGAALKQVPKGGVVGVFRNDAQEIVVLVVADVPLAAAGGAALAMIPATAAQDAARSGVLPPNMAENFREVINVMSGLLTGSGNRAVRLTEFAVGTVPEQAGKVFSAPVGRLDLELDIQGYGKGALSFIVA